MELIEEFKAFAMRGNVVDLAVAVVIGAAFGKIVSSLVDSIIMPIIGLLLGGIDFTHLNYKVGDAVVAYGTFIQSVVDFIIIAFVIFMVLRVISRFEKKKEAAPAAPAEDIVLLREIRDALKR